VTNENKSQYEQYFQHLRSISVWGKLYKAIASTLIYFECHKFGTRMIEVGSGVGSGILGAFPSRVIGLDVNPYAVNYCAKNGMKAELIDEHGNYPLESNQYDVCILDNVLEHIENPKKTLDECYRITQSQGGLVIVVPGIKGYQSDSDHKVFYNEESLIKLDNRFLLQKLFALPSICKSQLLSRHVQHYCLVAVYKKLA
jgi:SAM-dependent methyltransferase